MTDLLDLKGVTKSFPGVKALENVQLNLAHGEVLGLIGENGAGKSTLMKLLSGIYQPDAGTFVVDGRAVAIPDTKTAAELGISIIHQEFNLATDLTVAQNIFLGREPTIAGLFVSERRLNAKAAELLARVGIPLDPRTPVGELTVAKQQMVEIAKALSFDSKVLIMDEPTAALNDQEVEALHGIIRSFVSPSTGVIYISHRMEELGQITERITVLRDGHYVDTVPTAETPLSEVIAMMVGRHIATDVRPDLPARPGPLALRVTGLTTKTGVKDASLEVRAGEIIGLAGLMGAGRTEVARAIVGADVRTAGIIEVRGKPAAIDSPAAAARLGIGYLSEDRKALGLLLEHSVAENIALSSFEKLSAGGFVQSRKLRRTASSYVSDLRIKTPGVDQTVKFLSGGNQQKVVIARWLLKDCDVLIFDEPTRGIDVGAKDEIYRLLGTLAEQGKAIIVISSELPEVLRLAHRVIVMCEGRVAGELPNAQATQENIMELATRFRTDAVVVQEVLEGDPS